MSDRHSGTGTGSLSNMLHRAARTQVCMYVCMYLETCVQICQNRKAHTTHMSIHLYISHKKAYIFIYHTHKHTFVCTAHISIHLYVPHKKAYICGHETIHDRHCACTLRYILMHVYMHMRSCVHLMYMHAHGRTHTHIDTYIHIHVTHVPEHSRMEALARVTLKYYMHTFTYT